MPYVNVKITKGNVSVEQKRSIVKDITASLVNHLGKRPDHIHIVIDEVEPDNWGFAGLLTTEYRVLETAESKSQNAPPFNREYIEPRVLKSHPGKKEALIRFISTMYQFQKEVTPAAIDKMISQLQKAKVLTIDPKGKVTYPQR